MTSQPGDRIRQLEQRVGELEAQLRSIEEERDQLRIFRAIAHAMDVGLYVWRLTEPGEPRSIIAVDGNAAAAGFMGVDLRDHVGRRIYEAFPGALDTGMPQLFTEISMSGTPRNLGEQPYKDEVVEGVFTINAIPFEDGYLAVLFENITERKRAEQALTLAAEQDAQIRAQQAALDELSLPFIPISDSTVVMPLVGVIDSHRAQVAIETLLSGVSSTRASTVILDVTGVPVVDTQVANTLISAASAVQLLGARVMLTGIRPEVAQTLVGLGINLENITTPGTLQAAIARALRAELR